MNLDEVSSRVIKNSRNEPILLESILKKMEELKVPKHGQIIDIAGGLGFPFLDLESRGFLITYADGSNYAFNQVVPKAIHPENCYHILWHQLENAMGKNQFSYVLCIGQSLPYCISWNNLDEKSAKKYLNKVFRNIAKITKERGILHVDYAPQPSDDYLLSHRTDRVTLDGCNLNIVTHVSINKAKERKLLFEIEDGRTIEKTGLNVTRNLLVAYACRSGFTLIHEEKLRGDLFHSLFFRKNKN